MNAIFGPSGRAMPFEEAQALAAKYEAMGLAARIFTEKDAPEKVAEYVLRRTDDPEMVARALEALGHSGMAENCRRNAPRLMEPLAPIQAAADFADLRLR